MHARSHHRVAQRILFSLLASLPVINILVLLGGTAWSAWRRRARLAQREQLLAEAVARGVSPCQACQACKRAGQNCPGCDAGAPCLHD